MQRERLLGTEPRTTRIAELGLSAFAALVPFQALGPWSVPDVLRFELCDWLLAASLPWLLLAIWRARSELAHSQVLRGWLALTLAGTLSLLGRDRPWVELARVWAPVLLVAGIISLSPASRSSVLRAAVGGGAVALSAGLIGYVAAAVGFIPEIRGQLPFAYRSLHPLFPDVLRLAGTFGESCESLGEYAIVWLSLLLVLSRNALGLALGAATLLLTFSSAWIGLPLMAAAAFRRHARLALAVALALCLAASWFMNFGRPGDPGPTDAPCAELDVEHYVTVFVDRTRCRQLGVTTYRQAKEAAWRAFALSPWTGIGSGGFREFAQSAFAPGVAATFYQSPHSTWFGILAERGLCGLVALGFFVWTLYRTRPGDALYGPLTAAALALLLISWNADLLHQRYVWLWSALCNNALCGPGGRALGIIRHARAHQHQTLESR
jgi:hypothetical protein